MLRKRPITIFRDPSDIDKHLQIDRGKWLAAKKCTR